MKAIKTCTTTKGILYIDERYNCWIFENEGNSFSLLKKALPLAEYTNNGFGNVDGENIALLIAEMMSRLFYIGITLEFPFDPIIIKDINEGMKYEDTPYCWHDNLIFHKCLVWLDDNKKEIMLVHNVEYSFVRGIMIAKDAFDFYSSEDLSPLTDKEIDKLKHRKINDNELFNSISSISDEELDSYKLGLL